MEEPETKVTKQADVIMLEDDLVVIDDTQYRLIENHDNGFDREKIEERYNSVLNKYDYIVGDWGYGQLRFKGFYLDKRIESNLDNKISHLEDYLVEYCNFGCAYFILERVEKLPLTKPKHHRQKSRRPHTNNPNNQHNKNSQKNSRANSSQHKPANRNEAQTTEGNNKRKHPRIRKRKTEISAKTNNSHSTTQNSKQTSNSKRSNPRSKSSSTKSGARAFKIRKIDK